MPKRHWYSSAVLLFVLVLACSWLVGTRWPRPIRSYRDQVEYALAQQSLTAQHIQLGQRWPDNINFQYGENVFPYAYPVDIILSDGRKLSGHLQCAKLERNCSMRIRELGMQEMRLPDFTKAQGLPIPAWAEKPMRAVLRGLGIE